MPQIPTIGPPPTPQVVLDRPSSSNQAASSSHQAASSSLQVPSKTAKVPPSSPKQQRLPDTSGSESDHDAAKKMPPPKNPPSSSSIPVKTPTAAKPPQQRQPSSNKSVQQTPTPVIKSTPAPQQQQQKQSTTYSNPTSRLPTTQFTFLGKFDDAVQWIPDSAKWPDDARPISSKDIGKYISLPTISAFTKAMEPYRQKMNSIFFYVVKDKYLLFSDEQREEVVLPYDLGKRNRPAESDLESESENAKKPKQQQILNLSSDEEAMPMLQYRKYT